MGLLTDVEQRIDALVRKVFPKRAQDRVQPVEIAREMARMMEYGRTLSVDAVYVPNVFRASVSPDDFAALRPVINTVRRDAASHVKKVAAKRGYSFTGPVRLEIAPDQDVALGRVVVVALFEEDAEMERPASFDESAHESSDVDQSTRLYDGLVSAVGVRPGEGEHPSAWLEVLTGPEAGTRLGLVVGRTYLIGRAADADLVLSDNRVSKSHAELIFRDGAWCITDLDSTNGTRKNGKAVTSDALADGDQIAVGLTTLAFVQDFEKTRIGLEPS